jgi:AraC-like DNA-binding protein
MYCLVTAESVRTFQTVEAGAPILIDWWMTRGVVMRATIAPSESTVLEKRDAMIRSDVGKPRGVLKLRDDPKSRLVRLRPAADLAVFVEHFWLVEWDLRGREPRVQETLPQPSVHLVIDRGQSGVWGIVKGKFSRLLEAEGRAFGIKFRPGGFYPFIRSPVSRLINRVVPIGELFGPAGQAYEMAILALDDDARLVATAEAFLRGLAPARDMMAETMGDLVDRIVTDRGITTVDTLAVRSGFTTRSLQRLFARYIGVSPKWVIKRFRLIEVIDQLAGGATIDWTRLAMDLGYFDQAHFIKDFKSIIGRTPGDYLRETATD